MSNEIIAGSYADYKHNLDEQINGLNKDMGRVVERTVRIGYLLKQARDTTVLYESGYKTVAEFAKAEYGLDKSQVSRFISINDRFSVGGYSEEIQPQYLGFGFTKLSLMLQLPDAVNEALDPSYSKSEIQAIKDEVDAEAEVSDIEIAIEAAAQPAPDHEETALDKVIYAIGREHPEIYADVYRVMTQADPDLQELADILAPDDMRTYSARVIGMGRMLLVIDKASYKVVSVRSGESWRYGLDDVADAFTYTMPLAGSVAESWEQAYHDKYPIEEAPAPAQKSGVAPAQQKKKESKVVKSKPAEKAKPTHGLETEPADIPKQAEREEVGYGPEEAQKTAATESVPKTETDGEDGKKARAVVGAPPEGMRTEMVPRVAAQDSDEAPWIKIDGKQFEMISGGQVFLVCEDVPEEREPGLIVDLTYVPVVHEIRVVITHVDRYTIGIEDGYCVIQFEPVEDSDGDETA